MIILILLIIGCKEVYKPDIISSPNTYLVVEGVLNAGTEPSNLRLTRTYKLDDTSRLRSENNAMVTVEGKDNSSRALNMTADGIYSSPALHLTIGQEYRLRIKTDNGKEYLSDYVTARQTPAIDSLGFKQDDKGVEVHVNTHDAFNNTRYYRWDYDETWEIRSYYFSVYKYENDTTSPRLANDYVNVCWKYGSSTNIILGSTAALDNDIVYRAPVRIFHNGDERIAERYSILLRQYALDKTGYEFYQLMRKNTESLGTIFDAQPSELKGNIHCLSNPEEIVIGYLSASTIETKRYFIDKNQLNGWKFYEDCPMTTIPNHKDSLRAAYEGGRSIITAMFSPFAIQPLGFYVSYSKCVDCRARGGDLQRPPYW